MTLEKAGIPTCTVITDAFAFKTRKEAEILEMGSLPMVILPHPVGQLRIEEMRRITDANYDEIAFALTAGTDALRARYTGRTAMEPFAAGA